jgi:hypothetical protein
MARPFPTLPLSCSFAGIQKEPTPHATQRKDTIIKLAVASLIVGLFLGFFNIDPRELLAEFGDTVQKIFSIVASVVEWGVKYVLLGAVVVVPIWLIFFLIGRMRGRKSR